MNRVVAALCLLCVPVCAQMPVLPPIAQVPDTPKPLSHKVWLISVGTLVAANVFDASSTVGKHEVNPLIGNRPNQAVNWQRMVELKGLTIGVPIGLQFVFNHYDRTHMADKLFAGTNFVLTGFYTGIGWHNMGVAKVKH